MRNIAIVAVISLVSYYSYILIDAHINSEKAAEAARVADAAAQHKSVEQLEKIAEKYYNSLLVERKQTLSDLTNDAFLKINPQFPCLFGEVPITKQDENDALVTDGHKYACGLKAISGKFYITKMLETTLESCISFFNVSNVCAIQVNQSSTRLDPKIKTLSLGF